MRLTHVGLHVVLVTVLFVSLGPAAAASGQDGLTPLHEAVLARDDAASRDLIAAGAPIDAVDRNGRTALHLAALGGREDAMEMLLDRGADPGARDVRGDTPLHLAARRLRSKAVEMLLAAGADVNARNDAGRTPLHLLADQGPDADELDVRMTATAELLLACGAETRVQDDAGCRAVDYAAWRGHRRLATLLAKHGAAPRPRPPQPAAPVEYHTYPEIEAALLQAELDRPDLCRRVHLGQTVQGRDMWALEISDNVGLPEDEPEVKLISTMHGDEVVGAELLLLLVDHLVSTYGLDPRITRLVDEMDIWLVPCMNPDGHVSQSRYNANGVNLNRDFPDPYTSPENTTFGRQPETANIMDWSFGRSFTLAANYHCGALVVNYPFDANESGQDVYTASPDDDLFIVISEAYSWHNTPMWESPYFEHGITNGADWYMIHGGMQDWSYVYMGTNEVTIEVSGSDRPPSSQIPVLWNENRESMLAYLETALTGVRGIVTDGGTGLPLDAAVTVIGRDHDVYTDPDVGDYHRMVLPGVYDLRFESSGHDPRVVPGVVVSDGDAVREDVTLGPPADLLTPDGDEDLVVGVPVVVAWTGQSQARFQVQHAADYGAQAVTQDGFESGSIDPAYESGGDATWFATTQDAWSGAWSARAGDVDDLEVSWLRRTAGGGEISFRYRVSSESGYDFFSFSADGERLVHASGTSGGWTLFTTTLPAGTHELEWSYAKDGSVSHGSDTAWIDDIELVEELTTWTDIVALTDPGVMSVEWTPDEASDAAKVRVRASYGENGDGRWDESTAPFAVLAGTCTGDVDGSGDVGFDDLLAVLSTWGPCSGCPEDVDGSGAVGFGDLLEILSRWGACP